MSSNNQETKTPFILSQLEEALEERQRSERRQNTQPLIEGEQDRRKGDRRKLK